MFVDRDPQAFSSTSIADFHFRDLHKSRDEGGDQRSIDASDLLSLATAVSLPALAVTRRRSHMASWERLSAVDPTNVSPGRGWRQYRAQSIVDAEAESAVERDAATQRAVKAQQHADDLMRERRRIDEAQMRVEKERKRQVEAVKAEADAIEQEALSLATQMQRRLRVKNRATEILRTEPGYDTMLEGFPKFGDSW